jgi:lipopolysaccharide export system protein LptA
MKKNSKIVILLSSIAFSFSSIALESDSSQPIHVSSQSQHAQMKKNVVIFFNNVLLTQGSMKLTANKLTVTRSAKAHHETMLAEGNPATFYRTLDDKRPVNAEAKRIYYDVANAKITLTGDAQVKQLTSQVNGEKIIYYLHSQELIVKSGTGKNARVKTILLPSQFEKKKKTTKKK